MSETDYPSPTTPTDAGDNPGAGDVDVSADDELLQKVVDGDNGGPTPAEQEPGAVTETPDDLGGTGGPDAGGAG
jgi:hypothetical protein